MEPGAALGALKVHRPKGRLAGRPQTNLAHPVGVRQLVMNGCVLVRVRARVTRAGKSVCVRVRVGLGGGHWLGRGLRVKG